MKVLAMLHTSVVIFTLVTHCGKSQFLSKIQIRGNLTNLRPFEAILDHQRSVRPLEADGGHWRPLEVTEGHWRSLEATGGHWRPLDGHWRLLEVI